MIGNKDHLRDFIRHTERLSCACWWLAQCMRASVWIVAAYVILMVNPPNWPTLVVVAAHVLLMECVARMPWNLHKQFEGHLRLARERLAT